jgi:hypothetical protein
MRCGGGGGTGWKVRGGSNKVTFPKERIYATLNGRQCEQKQVSVCSLLTSVYT